MFLNIQAMFPIRHTIITMDHQQPENANPLKSDSKTMRWNFLLVREAKTFQTMGYKIPLAQGLYKNGPLKSLLGMGNT